MDFTSRLKLNKPDGDPVTGDFLDVTKLNENFDKIDSVISATVCTSSSRPSSPFVGQVIWETDTSKVFVCSESTAPATWLEISLKSYVDSQISSRVASEVATQIDAALEPINSGWTTFSPKMYTEMSSTPTVISSTIEYARYKLIGKTCTAQASSIANATTTGGVGIELPFTASYRNFNCGTLAITGTGSLPADRSGPADGSPGDPARLPAAPS